MAKNKPKENDRVAVYDAIRESEREGNVVSLLDTQFTYADDGGLIWFSTYTNKWRIIDEHV